MLKLKRFKKHILFLILSLALVSRLLNLTFPETFYFDEVYHAFTAKEFVEGNPAAWEYWATPPEGFAFEWTHPPLAKLIMAAGITLFGQNPFSWRIFGVLAGVGIVFLVYQLGRALFKKEAPSLVAAFLVATDGLFFTMSRVGMNDIYLVFFALLTLLSFLKQRHLLAAFSLGLAISSKWSAIWLILILFFWWLIKFKKADLKYISYLLLPPIVYLASYVPFFTSGHTLSSLWDTQRQMWWYHTGLEASHPFTSPWWSWPLLLKPIWLFTTTRDGLVANIYAMGNPLFLWGGLLAVGWVLVRAAKGSKEALLLQVAYLAFFLPWAFSPRIMFLYHYLPSLPFLALMLGWLVTRLRRKVAFVFLGSVFLTFLFFSPLWGGIFLPPWLLEFYQWLPSWQF